MMTVSDEESGKEWPVYIGQTNSQSHRFTGGHAAIYKLHGPKYTNKLKKLYFGRVSAQNDDDNIFPVEWINPLEIRSNLLSSVEYYLIYDLQPELNTKGKDNYLVPTSKPITIQMS